MRAVSLSQEPVFSLLKSKFVCGVSDITGKSYAGSSGNHAVDGKAIDTTNGAGPHNLQLFVLAADGTVLHCLPGFWNPQDLAYELKLAQQLNWIWCYSGLTPNQKAEKFRALHLAHLKEHPQEMTERSNMQGFDQEYEAKHRLYSSDTIADIKLILTAEDYPPSQAFKTTDCIMHERMAARPFLPFEKFDIAQYSDYGLPAYDLDEERLDARGNNLDSAFMTNPMPDKVERESIVKEYR